MEYRWVVTQAEDVVRDGGLVGRTRELAWLEVAVRTPGVVALLGPGGIGKTRLARAVVESMAPRFDEVHFVSLASEEDGIGLARAMVAALALDARGNTGALSALVGGALGSRGATLVVLDNVEQIVGVVRAALSQWSSAATRATFLVTSRHAIGLAGERTWELAPLPLPPEDGALGATASEQLFMARVHGFRPDYAPDASERASIAEIVRRLDGVPLAIELAASRMRLMSTEALRTRLADPMRALTPAYGRSEQRSLESAVARSWSLLDAIEQRVLAECAVFRGGFTLEAAEAVVSLPPGAPAVLDLLHSLREKSLLTRTVSGERLGMLESIRTFAAERLVESGQARATAAKLGIWLIARASAVRPGGGSIPEERANLRAALEHLVTGEPTPQERALALGLVAAMDAPPASDGLGPEELILAELALSRPCEVAPELGLRVKLALARSIEAAGRADDSERLLREVLDDATRIGDCTLAARAAIELAAVLVTASRVDGVPAMLARAAELAARAGDDEGHVFAMVRRAAFLCGAGRRTEGRAAFALAERAVSASVGARVRASLEASLGSLALEEHELDVAISRYERAIVIADSGGVGLMGAIVRGYLGVAKLAAGDGQGALSLLESATHRAGRAGYLRARVLFRAVTAATLATLERGAEAAALAEELRAVPPTDATWEVVTDLWLAQVTLAGCRARQDFTSQRWRSLAITVANAREKRISAPRGSGARPRVLEVSDDARIALGLLERSIARTIRPPQRSSDGPRLLIGGAAAWFCVEASTRVDLRRRDVLRRVLWALTEKHLDDPLAGLTTDALVAAAWPGERIQPRAAASRLYTALRELRALGLRAALVREPGGYRLAAEVIVSTD